MSYTRNHQSQAQAREFKHRVLTCLHKLSDRDTYTAAAAELEAMAKTLTSETLPLYLSAVSTTDPSDKSLVRRQCLRLITILSQHHGNSLAPHLSKLISSITRRLRDSDSNIRSACIAASSAISAHLTKPPFSLITKPFFEALFTEQEVNAQIGAAMCLAAAVDAAADPDVAALRKVIPRLEKLVKCESFKAKAALLTLIGSVIGVGGAAGSQQIVKNLVPCLAEFVSSDDWAARKAAADALGKLAVVEREVLSEFKASCLKTFEAKRFDKVKAVRETMNQMLAAWKEIPDLSDEVSLMPESQSSCKDIASDGRYPPGSKVSYTVTSGAPQGRKRSVLANKSSVVDGSSATTAKKRSPLDSTARTGAAMFRKLDHKKPSDRKVGHFAHRGLSETIVSEDDTGGRDETKLDKSENDRDTRREPETRRALFNKNSDKKMQKLGVSKVGSRVVPYLDDRSESTVVISNEMVDHHKNQKESEDLSLIRTQLVQIENQQSSLLDLLQRFIGSSEGGMRSLESRVHGLELALDEISFDLAVSTRRMSNNDFAGTMCCKLPGTEFFSSKLWKKSEGQSSTSRLPSSGIAPVASMQNIARNGDTEAFKPENRRYRFRGGHGIIVNPLAKIPIDPQGISEASSSRVSKNIRASV